MVNTWFPEFSKQSSDIPSFTPFSGTPGVGASVGAGIFVITGVAAQPCGPAVCGWDGKRWGIYLGKWPLDWGLHFFWSIFNPFSIIFKGVFSKLTWAGLQIHGPPKIEQLSTRKKWQFWLLVPCFWAMPGFPATIMKHGPYSSGVFMFIHAPHQKKTIQSMFGISQSLSRSQPQSAGKFFHPTSRHPALCMKWVSILSVDTRSQSGISWFWVANRKAEFGFSIWQCVKTLYPFCSHQNSWDLWMFIPLKMVSIGIDPYPYHLERWATSRPSRLRFLFSARWHQQTLGWHVANGVVTVVSWASWLLFLCGPHHEMAMDQYLLIPFLGGYSHP